MLEPKPDEIRLWSDTLVRALFEIADGSRSRRRRSAARPALGPHITECAKVRVVERRDWERVWLQDLKRCVLDGACGCARRRAPRPRTREAVIVRLDPGLAFGTGTHPTTALCLQMLEAMPRTGRT